MGKENNEDLSKLKVTQTYLDDLKDIKKIQRDYSHSDLLWIEKELQKTYRENQESSKGQEDGRKLAETLDAGVEKRRAAANLQAERAETLDASVERRRVAANLPAERAERGKKALEMRIESEKIFAANLQAERAERGIKALEMRIESEKKFAANLQAERAERGIKALEMRIESEKRFNEEKSLKMYIDSKAKYEAREVGSASPTPRVQSTNSQKSIG